MTLDDQLTQIRRLAYAVEASLASGKPSDDYPTREGRTQLAHLNLKRLAELALEAERGVVHSLLTNPIRANQSVLYGDSSEH